MTLSPTGGGVGRGGGVQAQVIPYGPNPWVCPGRGSRDSAAVATRSLWLAGPRIVPTPGHPSHAHATGPFRRGVAGGHVPLASWGTVFAPLPDSFEGPSSCTVERGLPRRAVGGKQNPLKSNHGKHRIRLHSPGSKNGNAGKFQITPVRPAEKMEFPESGSAGGREAVGLGGHTSRWEEMAAPSRFPHF